jgi:hypothetical protein
LCFSFISVLHVLNLMWSLAFSWYHLWFGLCNPVVVGKSA